MEARTATEISATRPSRHRTLVEINEAIASRVEMTELLATIVRKIKRALSVDRVSITLYDPDTHEFRIHALEENQGFQLFRHGARIRRGENSALTRCFDECEVIVRHDLARDCRFFEDRFFYEDGFRSLVNLPLIARNRALGTLNIGSRIRSAFSVEEVEFLSVVAGMLGLALGIARARASSDPLTGQLQAAGLHRQDTLEAHTRLEIVGASQALRDVLRCMEAVASTNATVLLLGETGTGKELLARAIHANSPRRSRPLIKVNCAALPPGLVDIELFGHEEGAFTGALCRRLGGFELADGGTLFLDEIGELRPELQAKLLRVLEEQGVERIGGTRTLRVNLRVIAATSCDLTKAVQAKLFRPDLYYRLDVFPIEIPPLRDRASDIPHLAHHFTKKYGSKLGKCVTSIAEASLAKLVAHSWPGNIRELENVIHRAMILSRGSELRIGGRDPATAVAQDRGVWPGMAPPRGCAAGPYPRGDRGEDRGAQRGRTNPRDGPEQP